MSSLERKAEEYGTAEEKRLMEIWADGIMITPYLNEGTLADIAARAFLAGSKVGQREMFDCGWNAGCAWMDDNAPHPQPTQDQAFSDYLSRKEGE